jgi:hypothetical protein
MGDYVLHSRSVAVDIGLVNPRLWHDAVSPTRSTCPYPLSCSDLALRRLGPDVLHEWTIRRNDSQTELFGGKIFALARSSSPHVQPLACLIHQT